MENYSGFARIFIGGKERPFYYGIAAAEIYCEELQKELHAKGIGRDVEFYEFQEALEKAFGGEKVNPIYAAKVFSACLLAGCEYVEEDVDFSPKRVKFWLQEFTPETHKQVLDVIVGANKSPNATAPRVEPQNQ